MKSNKKSIIIPIALISSLSLSNCLVYATGIDSNIFIKNNEKYGDDNIFFESIEEYNDNGIYIKNKMNGSGKVYITSDEIINKQTIDEQTIDDVDRYATAALVSKKLYSKNNNVVLAMSEVTQNGDKTGLDAYTGSILAGSLDCPLLYSKTNQLTTFTKNEIERLNAKNVYIVGGTTQISTSVEKELLDMGLNVKRIYGTEIYETSLEIAQEISKNTNVNEVIVVNGFNVNSINAAVLSANMMNAPILYIKENNISNEALRYIQTNSKGVYFIGAEETGDGLGISTNVINKVKNVASFVKVQESSDPTIINLWLNSNRNTDKTTDDMIVMGKTNIVDGTFISLLGKKNNALPMIIDSEREISNDEMEFLKSFRIKNIYKSYDVTGNGYESLYKNLININNGVFDEVENDDVDPDMPQIPSEPEIPETPIEPEIPNTPSEPEQIPGIEDTENDETITPDEDTQKPDDLEEEIPSNPESSAITITQSDSSYKRIKGTIKPETKIAAYTVNKNGKEKLIGKAESDENGKFDIKLTKKQAHNTEVVLYTFTEDGEKENKTTIIMKDATAPEEPFVTNTIRSNTTVVKGESEAKVSIVIKDSNNNIIGKDKCNESGKFSIQIEKQSAGTKLFVYAIDEVGNESQAEQITVKDAKQDKETKDIKSTILSIFKK